MTDSRDGKMYKTVVIGTQTWMAENLNYDVDESRCYDNDESNCNKYGRLYTWYDAKAACPANWHLPSNDEWNALFTTVGGNSTASIMLKSQSDWYSLGNGLDFFGFSALPAGYCTKSYCLSIGMSTSFWSSTEYDDEVYIVYDTGKKDSRWLFGAHNALLQYNSDNVSLLVDPNNQNDEYSVRCLKNTLSSSSVVPLPQSSSSSISVSSISSSSSINVSTGTMTDSRDGQTYETVTIGTHTWMAENLNYEVDESWCYDNDVSNCSKYGRLYEWNAAAKACPRGWHLPTKVEFETLFDVAGGIEIAGSRLKSSSGWNDVNSNHIMYQTVKGYDSFGFSALPAGKWYEEGGFGCEGYNAYFWSSTETDYSGVAYYMELDHDTEYAYLGVQPTDFALSVRCHKD